MITPLLTSLIQQDLNRHFNKARVTINGIEDEYEIYETIIRDNIIKKYVYIEDEPQGLIERAVLVDQYGRELIVQEPNLQKGQDGWIISFKLIIEIKDESAVNGSGGAKD